MVTSSVFVALVSAQSALAAPKASDAHSASPHWAYDGEEGQSHWSELAPTFAKCAEGRAQSPVDLNTRASAAVGLDNVLFHYHPVTGVEVNNGHTVQVDVGQGDSIELDGARYDLAQFHLHTPSEHRLDGKQYPAELHFVHKDARGQLAVVGVFLDVGAPTAALADVFAAMPTKAGQQKPLAKPLDLASVLPPSAGTLRYEGSLTTPPCSEGVHWVVFREPVTVSEAQLASFKKLYSGNARELQAQNGRMVLQDTSF